MAIPSVKLCEIEAVRKATTKRNLHAIVRKLQLVLVIKRCLDERREQCPNGSCGDVSKRPLKADKRPLTLNLKHGCGVNPVPIGGAEVSNNELESLLERIDQPPLSNCHQESTDFVLDCIYSATNEGDPSSSLRLHEKGSHIAALRLVLQFLVIGQISIFEKLLDHYLDTTIGKFQELLQERLDQIDGCHDKVRERLIDTISRLRSIFGVGWFFEWPGGRHPLNSTWPWTQVKPSLMVLWGVCWMFFAEPMVPPVHHNFNQRSNRNSVDQISGSNSNFSGPTPWPLPQYGSTTPDQPMIDFRGTNMSLVPASMPLPLSYSMFPVDPSWAAQTPAADFQGSSRWSHGPYAAAWRPGTQQSAVSESGYGSLTFDPHTPSMMQEIESYFMTLNSPGFQNSNPDNLDTEMNLSPREALPPSHTSSHISSLNRATRTERSLNNVAQRSVSPVTQSLLDSSTLREDSGFRPQAISSDVNLNYEFRTAPFTNSTNPSPQPTDLRASHSSRHSAHSRQHQSYNSASHPTNSSLNQMATSYSVSQYPPPDMGMGSGPYTEHVEQEYPMAIDRNEFETTTEHHEDPEYPTPTEQDENTYNTADAAAAAAMAAAAESDTRALELQPIESKEELDESSPGRSKPVPKPFRVPKKDVEGRFYCDRPDCTEDVKAFNRKCEWNKHMDKHERPYKCKAPGCEKLPGFTYSGGLLRHEREVHNKHGGPRKQLNCPHSTCKRHTGKGFSRQENLNEHLRRVHTDTDPTHNEEETEGEAADAQTGKRKRKNGESDVREEMKRLRQENEELRQKAELQTAQTADVLRQLQQLQASVSRLPGSTLQVPEQPQAQPLLSQLEG